MESRKQLEEDEINNNNSDQEQQQQDFNDNSPFSLMNGNITKNCIISETGLKKINLKKQSNKNENKREKKQILKFKDESDPKGENEDMIIEITES